MMIDKTETDNEPKEDIEDRKSEILEEKPKPMLFQRYYEPRYIATKVSRLKQYQMRRV
jgi:hypothetical protein